MKKYVLPVPNPAVINPDSQVARKEIGRRGFLVGALALGGLTLAGIGVNAIAEYLNPPPDGLYKKILDTPFAADELPRGWIQVRSYPSRELPDNVSVLQKFGGGKVSRVSIILQIPGKEEESRLYGIPGIGFTVFESSQKAQTVSKQYRYPGSRLVSGIGDMAWFDSYNPPPYVMGRYFVVVDQVLLVALAKGDEQNVLSLAKSGVKYLARIGVTPGVK